MNPGFKLKRLIECTLMSSILVFVSCSSPKNEEATESNPVQKISSAIDSIDWRGTWSFTDNAPIDYTLTIGEIENEMYLCRYKAEGAQTSYELDCLGVSKGETFELYFQNVKEGVFLPADQINRDKPALTLNRMDGKILTYWDQLFNNYVEEGNHTGKVCFQRMK